MKKGMHEDFRRAEKLGKTYVRDLFYAILNEAYEDKDLERMNELFVEVICNVDLASKEMRSFYDGLLTSYMKWLKEKCVVTANGDIVGFKGE